MQYYNSYNICERKQIPITNRWLDFRQDGKKSDVMYVRGDLGSEGFGNPNSNFWVLERNNQHFSPKRN